MIVERKNAILSHSEFDWIKKRGFNTGMGKVLSEDYYDNDSFEMFKMGICCKICETEKTCRAVIEESHKEWKTLNIINSVPVKDLADNQVFSEIGLNFQGRMMMLRYPVCKSGNYSISIDKNMYLGNTDYELSIQHYHNKEECSENGIDSIMAALYLSRIVENFKDITQRFEKNDSKNIRFFNYKNMYNK